MKYVDLDVSRRNVHLNKNVIRNLSQLQYWNIMLMDDSELQASTLIKTCSALFLIYFAD